MKIAFPISEDKGLDSPLNAHFGTAKHFLVVDTENRAVTPLDNQKLKEGGSSCKTGVFGKDSGINAVVTQCIGDGSLRNLNNDEITVYAAQGDTVAENLDRLATEELKLFHIFDLCQGKKNKKEGGCGHHH